MNESYDDEVEIVEEHGLQEAALGPNRSPDVPPDDAINLSDTAIFKEVVNEGFNAFQSHLNDIRVEVDNRMKAFKQRGFISKADRDLAFAEEAAEIEKVFDAIPGDVNFSETAAGIGEGAVKRFFE